MSNSCRSRRRPLRGKPLGGRHGTVYAVYKTSCAIL